MGERMEIKPFKGIDGEEPLSKAISLLLSGAPAVIVLKDGKYYGLIDDRNMRLGIKNPKNVKSMSVAVRAPKLFEKELKDLSKVMMKFLSGHFRALPVVDDELNVKGIVSRAEVLKELLYNNMVPRISASTIMATPVYTVDASETFGRLKRLMKELNVHRFVVTKGRTLLGVISSYDFLMFLEKPAERQSMQLITKVKNADDLRVEQFVRDPIVIVHEMELLPSVVEKMVEGNISYAICVDSRETPTGIITAPDIFKLVLHLTSPKPPIVISGLSGEDLYYYDEIKMYLEKELNKLAKMYEISSAMLHVKKSKSIYSLRLSIKIEDTTLHVKAEDYDIMTALDKLLSNLTRVVKKMKDIATKRRAHVELVEQDEFI